MSRDRLKSVWAAHPAAPGSAYHGGEQALPVRSITYANMPAPSPRRGHSYTASDAPTRSVRPSLVPSLVPSIYSSYGEAQSADEYDDMSTFWQDLRDIQAWIAQLSTTIDRLAQLQSSSLSVLPDSEHGQRIAGEIDAHVKSARSIMQQTKAAIQELERTNGRAPTESDSRLKRDQTASAKAKFLETAQRLAQCQSDHRAAVRVRLSRQIRVVDPTMSEADLRNAVAAAEAGEGAIFTQAMASTVRSRDSRRTLDAVTARQAELAAIQTSLIELAALFQEMAMQVEEQDEKVVAIEEKARAVEVDMEVAHADLKQATVHARSARRKRWICFFVLLLILVVAGAATAIVLVQKLHAAGASNQGAADSTPASLLASTSTLPSSTASTQSAATESSATQPAVQPDSAAISSSARPISTSIPAPATVTVLRGATTVFSTIVRTVTA